LVAKKPAEQQRAFVLRVNHLPRLILPRIPDVVLIFSYLHLVFLIAFAAFLVRADKLLYKKPFFHDPFCLHALPGRKGIPFIHPAMG
jgi:hypothetical protein